MRHRFTSYILFIYASTVYGWTPEPRFIRNVKMVFEWCFSEEKERRKKMELCHFICAAILLITKSTFIFVHSPFNHSIIRSKVATFSQLIINYVYRHFFPRSCGIPTSLFYLSFLLYIQYACADVTIVVTVICYH